MVTITYKNIRMLQKSFILASYINKAFNWEISDIIEKDNKVIIKYIDALSKDKQIKQRIMSLDFSDLKLERQDLVNKIGKVLAGLK